MDNPGMTWLVEQAAAYIMWLMTARERSVRVDFRPLPRDLHVLAIEWSHQTKRLSSQEAQALLDHLRWQYKETIDGMGEVQLRMLLDDALAIYDERYARRFS